MERMPRPRPPFLHPQVTRHGNVVWYFRRGHGGRIRISGQFGTPEFDAQYQAALTGQKPLARPKIGAPATGTLAWLIERYRDSVAWREGLSVATKRQRENIFKHVIESAGTKPYSMITQHAIVAGRERRASTPAQARNYLDAMRGLFRWALETKHVRVDATAGVANPPRKAGPGFRMWAEDEMASYGACWPIGTRQRVWLDVLAYTGLRRGDAVRLGRQHVRGSVVRLKTEKNGVEVTLPILPVLQRTLDAGPCGDLTFIVGANGKPMTKESFGNAFKEACRAAGVSGSAHGVRKIAATRAAENGATVAELEAIFGWHGGAMASHYTREANRVRLARDAMHKLANDSRTSIPSPYAAGEGSRGKS
jgi:integrase